MKIEEITEMWAADSDINNDRLDTSALTSANLHAKYLEILVEAKLKLVKYKADHAKLRKLKARYYKGELSRVELDELGWDQYLYNKPLKTEMDDVINGDDDVIKLNGRISYLEVMISTLESILYQIKSRDFQIKNAIQWRIFMSGG